MLLRTAAQESDICFYIGMLIIPISFTSSQYVNTRICASAACVISKNFADVVKRAIHPLATVLKFLETLFGV